MTGRRVHPWLFLVLMIPFGVIAGYVAVTLGFQLGEAGVSVAEISALGALTTLPHTFKFFWSPLVDVTLSQKKWYMISMVLTAAAVASFGLFPATTAGLVAIGFAVTAGSVASTVVGMSVESLMAHSAAEETKGQAGGWFMGGNLGGYGIGGGLGLMIAKRVSEPWMASCSVAFLCVLCGLALPGLPSPARDIAGGGFFPRIGSSLMDLWIIVRQRRGLLALILCCLPVGVGASSNLWSVLGHEWDASPDRIAMVAGVAGGLVSAAGSIAGGFVCDRFPRQTSYLWFGIFVAQAGVALALLPRTPLMFTLCTLLFSFTTGLSWAAYSAFVLEAIGKGAAATKFSAFASLANAPLAYMAVFNGITWTKWGTTAMLLIEAGVGVLAAVLFVLAAKWFFPRAGSNPDLAGDSPDGGLSLPSCQQDSPLDPRN
jgi:MFS family permease